MSDTPETDDQPCIMAINENGYQVPSVDIDYARQLERERDIALNALREIAYTSNFNNLGSWASNKAKDTLNLI